MNGVSIIDSKSGDEMYTPKEFFPDYIWKKIENHEQLTEEESKIVDDIIFGGSSIYVYNPFGSIF